MTIQDKLRQNTIDIANARINLAGAMRHRLSMRHVQAEDEAALSIAVRRHMAESSLTNETARRAYADYQTAEHRADLSEVASDLLQAEQDVVICQAELDIALDARLYLLTLLRLGGDDSGQMLDAASLAYAVAEFAL